MLFEGAPEVERIQALTQHIEGALLPQLSQARGNPAAARSVVAALNQGIDEIKTLLGTVFDRFIEVEDGRDSVTRLLNRRYFPSVAKREISLALRQHGSFALLMVDIDHFLQLLVEAGDSTALQVADGLRSRVAGLHLRTTGLTGTSVTVSIGVAVFDGHPDYQRLVDRAEQALRQAKQAGRNRCQLAA